MADINLPVVSDSAVISESLAYYSDQIDINERLSILIPVLNVLVSDTITLTENVQLLNFCQINVSDNINISENVQSTSSDPQINLTNTITISENVQTPQANPQINVNDTITMTDVLSSDNPLIGGSDTSSSAPIIFLTNGQIAVRLSNKMYLPL